MKKRVWLYELYGFGWDVYGELSELRLIC